MPITIICHDSERDRTLRIAEPFVARGHKVSVASAGLRPDDEQWKSKSFNRFGNSSLILILLTKKSVVDKSVGWLVSQVLFEEGLPFVPVRLDDDLPAQQSWKMPSKIYHHDWLAFAEDDAARLLAFIEDLLPTPTPASAAAAAPETGAQIAGATPATADPEPADAATAAEPAQPEEGGRESKAAGAAAAADHRRDAALIARTATEGPKRSHGTGSGPHPASAQPRRSRIWRNAAAAAAFLVIGSAFAFMLAEPDPAPAPRPGVADAKDQGNVKDNDKDKDKGSGSGPTEQTAQQAVGGGTSSGAAAEPVDFEVAAGGEAGTIAVEVAASDEAETIAVEVAASDEADVAAGGETQRLAADDTFRPTSAQPGDAAVQSYVVDVEGAGPEADEMPAADPQEEAVDDPVGDVTDTADEAEADAPTEIQTPATTVIRRPNPAVVGVQRNLSVLGYEPGPVDGLIGPRTQRAIRAFEQRNGLIVTGRVTSQLVATLARQVREQTRRQRAGEDRATSDWWNLFGFGLDSVKNPEVFEEYCERNPETWIFDKGRGKSVFCGRVARDAR